MKRIYQLLAFALLLGMIAPASVMADKKKKEKKEKSEWKWEMPAEMTGIEEFDLYLRTCDTLNTKLVTYLDSVVFYSVKEIQLTDNSGNALTNADGTPKTVMAVVDNENHVRGSSEAFVQYARMTTSGVSILAEMAKISLLTASATASLGKDPMKILSYGKYLKAGPKMVSVGGGTIKQLLKNMKTQKEAIRAYKRTFTEAGELKDPTTDLKTVDGGVFAEVETIQKVEDVFNQEMAAANEADRTIVVPDDADIDIDSL